MNKIYFNTIDCPIENKYIKKESDKIVIDFLDDNYYFIRNNKDILCDKVEILNGLGIFFYYKGLLIKHIREIFLKVVFNESYNSIQIINTVKKETLVYLYYNNGFMPKELEDKLDFTNSKYEVGDIVYPRNVSYYLGESEEINSIGSTIFSYISCEIDMFKEDKKYDIDFESVYKAFEFVIVEKVGDMFYKVKIRKTSDDMPELNNTIHYSTDKDLATLDELKESAREMKESIRKFREKK